jgi:hypothetical protein
MDDNIDMDTSKQPRSAEEPGPQDKPLKDAEEALKDKTTPPPASNAKDETDESQDEEPGTFDRVYEHGRQMGF